MLQPVALSVEGVTRFVRAKPGFLTIKIVGYSFHDLRTDNTKFVDRQYSLLKLDAGGKVIHCWLPWDHPVWYLDLPLTAIGLRPMRVGCYHLGFDIFCNVKNV